MLFPNLDTVYSQIITIVMRTTVTLYLDTESFSEVAELEGLFFLVMARFDILSANKI